MRTREQEMDSRGRKQIDVRIPLVMTLGAVSAFGVLPPVSAAAAAAPSPGPYCLVLTDGHGDTSDATPGNSDSQLDIVGGYFQASRKQVVTVLKLSALTAEDVTNPAGRIYEFDFSVGSQNFFTMGQLLTGGTEFDAFISDQRLEENQSGARAGTGIGEMTGRVDLKHHEVRLSAPLSMFAKYAKFDQTNVKYFTAFTYKANGESLSGTQVGHVVDVSSSVGIGVDEAWSGASYNQFQRSCGRAVHGKLSV
jgi:hypothetical protein